MVLVRKNLKPVIWVSENGLDLDAKILVTKINFLAGVPFWSPRLCNRLSSTNKLDWIKIYQSRFFFNVMCKCSWDRFESAGVSIYEPTVVGLLSEIHLLADGWFLCVRAHRRLTRWKLHLVLGRGEWIQAISAASHTPSLSLSQLKDWKFKLFVQKAVNTPTRCSQTYFSGITPKRKLQFEI